MQTDCVLFARSGKLVTSWPIIAGRVSKDFASCRESASIDRLIHLIGRLKLCACIFVPETVASIRSDGGQRTMLWMKRDVVDRINILTSVVHSVRPMTFERKVFFGVLHSVHILNRNTAFDWTERKTARRGFFVRKNRDTSRLEFEIRIDTLVLRRLALQLIDKNGLLGQSYHCHRIDNISAIHSFWQVDSHYRIRWSHVPEFKRLVPTAGHQTLIVRRLDPMNCFDRSVVLSYLHALIAVQVPRFHRLVTRCGKHFGTVLF